MTIKFHFLIICASSLFVFTGKAQQFINGDLEGLGSAPSVVPTNWQNVPYDDINCLATSPGDATPDLTDTVDLGVSAGLCGRPYSGLTFISGLVGETFQEGIMQTVSGLEIGKTYSINFYQSVVKQNNALDKSGAWAIYIDNNLAGISATTNSELTYNNIELIWDARSITFTATATSHVIKFLPVDNDANGTFSMSDTAGALRMGIDAINLSFVTGIREYNTMLISVYPNPSKEAFHIKLPTQQTFTLSVTDITGRIIHTNKNATGNITFDASGFSSGVYFVKAVNERTVLTGKVVKE
jgi:hypothetical protein